ncbi:MAG: hypothetical protein JRI91_15120 [Deltaproteobacteria bacterium]|nr:hypothetical protein [Deltaproteobacteria bacterium]
MSKKPILHILMEIKVRELEGRTLLALEAASRGFRVFIGNKKHIKEGIMEGFLPSGIYFDKSLTRGKEEQLGMILNNGCLLASQDEEGGLLDSSYDRFLSFRSTQETVSMATSIFCWGDHDYEAWTRNYPNAAEKIHSTGSPRLDYWRPDFQGYFQEVVDGIKKRFGQFILVASNFAPANSYMTVEERLAQGKRNGSIRTMKDQRVMLNKIEDNKKMFTHFVRLIDFLAEKLSGINFVIRPHPAEKISGWENAVTNRANVHVIFEGGISPWVREASAILHNGCTTGMEAYVTGVPAIAYVPFKSPINREIPNKLSVNRTSKEEVSDVLSWIVKGESVNEHRTPENDQLIRNRLANVNGDTAAKRIVDVLETLDVPKAPSIKTGFSEWMFGKKIAVRHFLDKMKGIETKSMRKFPGLKLQEIKQIQNNLAAVTNKYMECEIKHLYGDVFVVEKN